jgi:hypothetical protein
MISVRDCVMEGNDKIIDELCVAIRSKHINTLVRRNVSDIDANEISRRSLKRYLDIFLDGGTASELKCEFVDVDNQL